MQQRHKNLRPKGAATSRKREDIRQGLQKGSRAGDRKARSRAFNQDSKNESQDIVKGSASSETKEETAHRNCRNT
jgi:hypothetical protein